MNVLALENPSAMTRISALAGACALAAGSTMVAVFDPSKAHFFPVCPLLALTGIACPGCGLTRAFHALFHGDFIAALDFNLLVPVWAVAFAWIFISLLLIGVRKKGLPMWPTNPKFIYGFFAVLFVFGVLRNIPAWPLTILYP